MTKAFTTGIADQRSYEGSVEQISGAAPADDQKHSHEEFNTVKNTIDQHAPLIDAACDLLERITAQSGDAESLKNLRDDIESLTQLLASDDTDLDTAQERVDRIKQLIADVESIDIVDVSGLRAELDALALSTQEAADAAAQLALDKENIGVAATLVATLEAALRGTGADTETLRNLRDDIESLTQLLASDDTDLDTAQERVDRIKQLIADVESIDIVDVSGLRAELDARRQYESVAAMLADPAIATSAMPVGTMLVTMSYEGGWNALSSGIAVGGNQYTIRSNAVRPAEDGGSVFHVGTGNRYLAAIFPNGVFLEQFGVKAGVDNAIAIKSATEYARLKGQGAVYSRGGVYPISSLVLSANVNIVGPELNALNIQDIRIISAKDTSKLVFEAVSGSTGILISAYDDSQTAGLVNVIVDATNHTGDVIVFDATVEVRNNNWLRNVLIHKGTGKQVYLTANNNGSLLQNVFCSGGDSRTDVVSDYGIYDESQDAKFWGVYAGFHNLRGIYAGGGAARWENADAWGSQQTGVEITGASTWYRLQSNTNNEAGLIINSQDVIISTYSSVNNNQGLAGIDGDVMAMGDCRGSSITNAKLSGADAGGVPFAFYQDPSVKTGLSIRGADISTSYPGQFDPTAEAYWDIASARTTRFPIALMRANQINTNLAFSAHAANAPVDWDVRNGGVAVREDVDVPLGYTTATRITSGSAATSGIMFQKSVADIAGTRVRVKALVKGTGAAFLGNQKIELFDGVASTLMDIPNDATWQEIAFVHSVDPAATHFQVRLLASVSAVPNLDLLATAVSIEVY